MKERVNYRQDSFIDFEGKERQFIIAVVTEQDDSNFGPIKTAYVGVAYCTPEDEFDIELGKTIAYGKAKKGENSINTFEVGLIGTKVVNALLEQECEYIKQNPGRYMPSYDIRKDKYFAQKKRQYLYETFSNEELVVLNSLKEMSKERYDLILSFVK